MRRVFLSLVCITVIWMMTSHVSAQNDDEVTVYIGSNPSDAEVRVGGKVLGRTPIDTTLLPGIYNFEFIRDGQSSGFIRIAVIGKRLGFTYEFAKVLAYQGLVGFTANTTGALWDDTEDILRVSLFYGQSQLAQFANIDVVNLRVMSDNSPLDIMGESTLRQRLNPDKTIFKSPLGTYLLYESPQTQQLVLLNTKTGSGDLSTFLGTPERVVWNPDESRAWLVQNGGQSGAFLFVTEAGIEVKYMPLEVNDASNTPVRISFILSYPTTDKRVPFIGFVARNNQLLEGLYVLDLETNHVTIIKEQATNEDERNRVYDAKFSADERYLYAVYPDRIVRYDETLQSETVSTFDADRHVAYARLSPSLRYVFCGFSAERFGGWIYKLP